MKRSRLLLVAGDRFDTLLRMLKELAADQFESTIKSEGVTFIDFWAPWCGPCQVLNPIVEQVATQVGDKAKIYKMNVDENPQIAMQFGIRSIPTIMLFKNGEPVEQVVGLRDKDFYIRIITQHAVPA